MSSHYFQTESDIIRTCGYIKDDKYIASIYGVSVNKVREMREKVHHSKRSENRAFREISEPVDSKNNERCYQRMMAEGSKRLLDSLMCFFNERERNLRNASKP